MKETGSMVCVICRHPSFKGVRTSKYCARCRKFARRGTFTVFHLDALIRGWKEAEDDFVCTISGLKLEDYDIHSPLFLNYDHRTPGVEGMLDVVANVFNVMKSRMTVDEFRAVLRELVRFWDTGKFDASVLDLKYWRKASRPPPAKARNRRQEVLGAPSKLCVVCGERALAQSEFCPRHYRFRRRKGFTPAYKAAMIKAWNKEANGFICYYSGLLLDEDDPYSPLYASFDHLTPGKDEAVMCGRIFNTMKSDMSEEEFRAVVRELVRHWDEGTAFNKDVLRLQHWYRVPRPGRTRRR